MLQQLEELEAELKEESEKLAAEQQDADATSGSEK